MTEQDNQIRFWGDRMWQFHWFVSSLLLVIYFIPTCYLFIRDILILGQSLTIGHYILYGWGFSFGIGMHLFTPMIIKRRKQFKKLYTQL